ncbi:MAG: type II toxin-antitoxin system HicB family antitoxin [Mycobacteriaceae bacterium]
MIIWPPAAAWVYQEFDGTWIAECEVRPGCFAGGATPEEAQRLLAEVRKTWDEANAMKERHQ